MSFHFKSIAFAGLAATSLTACQRTTTTTAVTAADKTL